MTNNAPQNLDNRNQYSDLRLLEWDRCNNINPRCEKTTLQGGFFGNTYDFAVGKSFHDSSYRKSTSSIPALCLDQDVLDRTTRI
ncbi:hypothetical protein OFN50_24740, partial [Escherichia coli]|nr:hypothetical protein [Escherichia coli]